MRLNPMAILTKFVMHEDNLTGPDTRDLDLLIDLRHRWPKLTCRAARAVLRAKTLGQDEPDIRKGHSHLHSMLLVARWRRALPLRPPGPRGGDAGREVVP
jgi:hypothetical protein